jgi:plastocyanin
LRLDVKRRRYQIAALAAAAGFGALFMVLPSSGSGVEVKMTSGLRFRPDSIRIDVGGAVTFVNDSKATHTATCRGCPQDTGDVQPEQFKTLTFPDSGAYLIFCRYHADQGMVATLTVGSGEPGTPAPSPTVAPTG